MAFSSYRQRREPAATLGVIPLSLTAFVSGWRLALESERYAGEWAFFKPHCLLAEI
jgi:hypothetical protein